MANFVIFSANYLPHIGGVEVFTEGLSKELANEGHNITIVTNNLFALPSYELLSANIEIVRFPCYGLVGGRFPIPRIGSPFKTLWKKLRSSKPDVVVVNTRFYLHSILGILFAKESGLKALVIDHGSAYLTFGNRMLDCFVRAYEHIITCVAKSLRPRFFGISKASVNWLKTFKIEAEGVIPNAVNVESIISSASSRDYRKELNLSDDVRIVTFTGRLVPEKGIRELVEAMGLLKDHSCHLVVAGTGPLFDSLLESSPGNVHYLNAVNQADVIALLLQSQLFCLPSRSEGFCNSFVEACACALPSVITNVGVVPEIIKDGDNGHILLSANPEEIAAAIRFYIENPAIAKKAGLISRNNVQESFNWSNTVLILCQAAFVNDKS